MTGRGCLRQENTERRIAMRTTTLSIGVLQAAGYKAVELFKQEIV